MGKEPDETAIRERAYQIWIEEGMPDGKAEDHWLRALWESSITRIAEALEHAVQIRRVDLGQT